LPARRRQAKIAKGCVTFGIIVKAQEVQFHREIYNQFLSEPVLATV
jgi:hypothetical protein